MTKVLYLIRGIPGAGKSYLANLITNANFSADDYFTSPSGVYSFDASKLKEAHEYCQRMVEYALKDNHPIVAVANTFTRKWEMEAYYKLAEKYGYEVVELTIKSNFKNTHGVPEDKIQTMKERFEY